MGSGLFENAGEKRRWVFWLNFGFYTWRAAMRTDIH